MNAAWVLIASLPAPAMEEVPPYCNQRMAACTSRDGSLDVLVVRTNPALEVSRWSPRTGARLWSTTLTGGCSARTAAICSISDQNGDGEVDWALVHTGAEYSYRTCWAFVTIGCGRTGAQIRASPLGETGPGVTICGAPADADRGDLIVGCPNLDGGRGAVAWLRSADASTCGWLPAPDGALAFGTFVINPIAEDAEVWIAAPGRSPAWSLWRASSPEPSSLSQLIGGVRSSRSGDHGRSYGWSLSVSRTPASLNDRTLVVGAPGRPADGRAGCARVGEWDWPKWVDGPRSVFGNHFGEVVLVTDDLDGDCEPDWLVTDPSHHQGQDDRRLFAGAVHVVLSHDSTARLLAVGTGDMHFLGLGLVAVGDLDDDGFEEVAALAMARWGDPGPYVEIWSPKRLQFLRSIPIWSSARS